MRFGHRRRRSVRRPEVAELNITAFMNLMVVLVPFLLITAVFTRTAILELSLPASDPTQADTPPRRPQITLYSGHLLWQDGANNPVSRTLGPGEPALQELRIWLRNLKQATPDNDAALILVAPDVDYATLIAVMDEVRSLPVTPGEPAQPVFPDISLGDAP